MRFEVLSIFPELFEPFARTGMIGRACEQGLLQIDFTHLRDFAINAQGQIDDTPYGGGSGMVLRPEPAAAAIRQAKQRDPSATVVLFTPRGKLFTAELAQQFARRSGDGGGGLILLPYRYEGVDERIAQEFIDVEVSIGDYVLMGGEVAAMALIEATARFVPGVLGNPESTNEESFQKGMLEYPQYTKPQQFEGLSVPDVLLSGNHAEIQRWRDARSRADTLARRPDLFEQLRCMPNCDLSVALVHYPVTNIEGKVVTTSITNMDVHDIARSSKTFGLQRYYIVHPTKALRKLVEHICDHWEHGFGSKYNPNRSDALQTISVVPDFDEVLADIEARTGSLPKIIATSARDAEHTLSYAEMRRILAEASEPHLLLLGTGWGLAEEMLQRADYQLAPIHGFSGYNHLSVRAAAAIILDRLFGAPG